MRTCLIAVFAIFLQIHCFAQERIRIGTYNAQFLPPLFFSASTHDGCCEDMFGSDTYTRARLIGERILALDYDIVILNEVFLSSAKVGFIETLQRELPFIVAELSDGDPGHQDSGLMLFSRFPIERLPRTTFGSDWAIVKYWPEELRLHSFLSVLDQINGVDTEANSHVAFIEFANRDACAGDDCLADKGVGYVRLRNPASDRIYNIAFTHLQAHNAAADVAARERQFGVIRELIEGTMTSEQMATEDIFLMGDLNVKGDVTETRTEWTNTFGASATVADNFFFSNLKDVWEFENGLTGGPDGIRDPGLTGSIHGRSHKRLDYILRNRPDQPADRLLAVQHMAVAYGLRGRAPFVPSAMGDAGMQDLSDHYGLIAELNLRQDFGSSSRARTDFPMDEWVNATMAHAGSTHWYRLDQLGTYTISLEAIEPTPAGFEPDFELYSSLDLSSPIPRSETNRFSTWTYQHSSGALFIKVFSRNSDNFGAYRIRVRLHAGECPDDAIVLYPAEPQVHFIADGRLRWFRIQTDAPHSGEAQRLLFRAVPRVPDSLTLQLLDSRFNLLQLGDPADPIISRSEATNNNSTLFLVVQPRTNIVSFQVGWETDLTVLHATLQHPLKIQCLEQTSDENGIGEDDDDVEVRVRADGALVAGPRNLGDFDIGQIRGLDDAIGAPIRFLREVRVRLEEDDELLLGANDVISGVVSAALPGETGPAWQFIDLTSAEDGGTYRFSFNLSHGLRQSFPGILRPCSTPIDPAIDIPMEPVGGGFIEFPGSTTILIGGLDELHGGVRFHLSGASGIDLSMKHSLSAGSSRDGSSLSIVVSGGSVPLATLKSISVESANTVTTVVTTVEFPIILSATKLLQVYLGEQLVGELNSSAESISAPSAPQKISASVLAGGQLRISTAWDAPVELQISQGKSIKADKVVWLSTRKLEKIIPIDQVELLGFQTGSILINELKYEPGAQTTPPALKIAIRVDKKAIELSWPTGQFQLESKADLASGVWEPVKIQPTLVNSQNVLSLPTDSPRRFFRLSTN